LKPKNARDNNQIDLKNSKKTADAKEPVEKKRKTEVERQRTSEIERLAAENVRLDAQIKALKEARRDSLGESPGNPLKGFEKELGDLKNQLKQPELKKPSPKLPAAPMGSVASVKNPFGSILNNLKKGMEGLTKQLEQPNKSSLRTPFKNLSLGGASKNTKASSSEARCNKIRGSRYPEKVRVSSSIKVRNIEHGEYFNKGVDAYQNNNFRQLYVGGNH
jgi:hypothetical protein